MLIPLRVHVAVVAVALVACAPASAVAQTTAQFPLQFDFTTPGARSLAMGGAFIGSADDASAAFTNPAGLVFYGRLEVGFEARFGSRETPFLSGGRVSGVMTGQGLDNSSGPIYSEDTDRRMGLTFLSMMLPVKQRFVVTGYRHEVARVSNSFFSNGVFFRSSFAGSVDNSNREPPIDGEREVSVTNYGGAVGIKITDTVGVGAGLSLYHFDLDGAFARHGVVSDPFSEADRRLISATAVQSGDDVSPSYNLGVLWMPRRTINVGASFRRGPRFDFVQRDQVPDALIDVTRDGDFKVPDVWGAGVKLNPLASERLRMVVDVSRVRYSQLRDDFVTIQALASGRPDQLVIDDGVEVRAGGEYQFGDRRIVIPRIGFWRDPDHSVRYVSTPAHDATDIFYEATLPGGETLIHFTFGVGVLWSELFEVHVGSDLSSRSKSLTMSFVARFKRTGSLPTP